MVSITENLQKALLLLAFGWKKCVRNISELINKGFLH
jgi:hypothetical protein